MGKSNQYSDDIRKAKSLFIVTALQNKADIKARKLIESYQSSLTWKPFSNLMIENEIWEYVVDIKKYDPKLVFCHPEVLQLHPSTSLYYRGLCGLSIKAAKDYFGSVESAESGKGKINEIKAQKMARTYNTFICSIIKNSTDWTLENGYRTIIATLGISLDGSMRNKIGEIAEERMKRIFVDWLSKNGLIESPKIDFRASVEVLPSKFVLKDSVEMHFSSEPDISFVKNDELLVVVEIKGGTDPAGALERYGAATKSFQHSLESNRKCKNFYISAVFTDELSRRIKEERLIEKSFDLIKLIEDPEVRETFFKEIFHHSLRIC